MNVITLEKVDREIRRRFPVLRFSPEIEPAFIAEYARNRARHAPLWALIGLAMYLFQLVDDYNLTPDVFDMHLAARIGLFTPVALFGVWAVRRWPTALNYDLLTLWVGVIGSLLPMSIVTQSDTSYLFVYQNGNVAAFLFFTVVLRPRLQVAVLGLFLMTLIHAGTMAVTGAFDELTYTSILSFVVTVAVFLAAGAYFLEHIDRMNFLHRLRGSLLHQQLTDMSERDELTGLFNRRSLARFGETLTTAPDRAVAAIMLDIDRFKLFNDVHGHLEGDECIRMVSLGITRTVGLAGTVYRFGGEEILVVLRDVASAASAATTAENIRASIEDLAIVHRGLPDGQVVTASLGVAIGKPSDCSLEDLIGRADIALYTAKRNGRNAVAVHGEEKRDVEAPMPGYSIAS